MSTGIEKMLQMANENQGFKKALQGCKSNEEVLSVLKDNNITVTSDELTQFTQSKTGELSDADLDGVSGAGCFMFG